MARWIVSSTDFTMLLVIRPDSAIVKGAGSCVSQAMLQMTLDTSIPDISIYRIQAYLRRSHIVNKHILDTRIFLFLLSHHIYACC